MERQLWKMIVDLILTVHKSKSSYRCRYSSVLILKVWFWSVINDRPVSWACERRNWSIWDRRMKLPSNATMSRRLRCDEVKQLLAEIEERVLRQEENGTVFWAIDGKPLTISGCSKDPHATYGRAAGDKAKGYKIHAIVGANGCVSQWRLAPMSKDERVMAKRMFKRLNIAGYIFADGNYDSNPLHKCCDEYGNAQLISPRRGGPGKALGHRKQTAGRLRSKEILEDEMSDFGTQMMIDRVAIERFFANLTNCAMGLTCLPSWVRTYRRVHRWVQAKMIINKAKSHDDLLTYAS